MSIESFNKFTDKYPDWKQTFEVYRKDSPRYQRIICRWKPSSGLRHEVHDTINVATGEIFMDCSKAKIFKKHLTLVFLRPIHTLIKTLYHLSIVAPLASELSKLITGKNSLKCVVINTMHSFTDIVLTPIYGIGMTLVNIAGVIFGVLNSDTLYYTRDLAGSLERMHLRTEKNPNGLEWSLSPCFSPIASLQEKVRIAEETGAPLKSATTVIAQNTLKAAVKNPDFFGNCRTHPLNTIYRSPIAAT